MLQLNAKRLILMYAGDAWEVEETLNDWHLIRHACTISFPKLITGWVGQVPVEETFAKFQERLKRMDKEREDNDESN